MIPVVYGLPLPDLFDQAERGLVVLGGCCVSDDDPSWRCNECDSTFGRVVRSPSIHSESGAENS